MNQAEAVRAKLDLVNAYKRLFVGEEGQLKPDARTFFADLSYACRLTDSVAIRDEAGRVDPAAHVYRDGQRAVWDHIQRMLGTDSAALHSKLNQLEQE